MILPLYDIKSKYKNNQVKDMYNNLTGQQAYGLRGSPSHSKGIYSRPYMGTGQTYSSKPDYFRSPIIPEIDIKKIYKRPGSP